MLTLGRDIGMHHGVTFNFGSAKVSSPAIFETCFSYDKDLWIAATDYYMNFYIIVLFLSTAVLQLIKFYSFIIFSVPIHLAIELSCFNTSSLHTFSFSRRSYFIYLNIVWTFIQVTLHSKVSRSLYHFTTSVSHGVENYFPRLWVMALMGVYDAILTSLIFVLINMEM